MFLLAPVPAFALYLGPFLPPLWPAKSRLELPLIVSSARLLFHSAALAHPASLQLLLLAPPSSTWPLLQPRLAALPNSVPSQSQPIATLALHFVHPPVLARSMLVLREAVHTAACSPPIAL